MTGSGQDRPRHGAHRGGADGRRAVPAHRPQGRPHQPLPDVPRPRAGRLPAVDQRGRRREGRASRPTSSPSSRPRPGRTAWPAGASTPERIKALRDAVGLTIYTPGSTAGRARSTSSARSRRRPTRATSRPCATRSRATSPACSAWSASPPTRCRRASTSCSPTSSRPRGRRAQSSTCGTLVGQVQQPPMRKLGVFELDPFFPPADRTDARHAAQRPARLALVRGVGRRAAARHRPPAAHAPTASPAAAIVSIAHLSDEERQFVVALVLSKVVTWMRKQSGTTDLRALVYMDEVAGYVPPTANPPTKKPIMTLMKQARAFGVGVVLATQNPVDIDYKAISNAGTWMVGRLQTERDKARLLDGMSAAAGGVDVGGGRRHHQRPGQAGVRAAPGRQGHARGVHDPVGDELPPRSAHARPDRHAHGRGPQRRGVGSSADPAPGRAAPATTARQPRPSRPRPLAAGRRLGRSRPGARQPVADDATPMMPEVAAGRRRLWLDAAAPWLAQVGGVAGGTRYAGGGSRPGAAALRRGEGRPRRRRGVRGGAAPAHRPPPTRRPPSPSTTTSGTCCPPRRGASYVLPDAPIKTKTFWSALEQDLVAQLVRTRTIEIFANRQLKLYSRAGETKDDVRRPLPGGGGGQGRRGGGQAPGQVRDEGPRASRTSSRPRRTGPTCWPGRGLRTPAGGAALDRGQPPRQLPRRSASAAAAWPPSSGVRPDGAPARGPPASASTPAQSKAGSISAQLSELESDLSDDILRITGGVGREGRGHRLRAREPGADRRPGRPAGAGLGARHLKSGGRITRARSSPSTTGTCAQPASPPLWHAVVATPRAWRNGRRAGFRSRFRKECGFDSHRPHRPHRCFEQDL